jgi:hypothetical protein
MKAACEVVTPNSAMNLADWVGVAGFVVAAALAILQFRPHWFLKPRFEVDFDWVHHGIDQPPRLEFTVTNVGHAPGAVTALLLQLEGQGESLQGGGFTPGTLDEQLPLRLPAGAISNRLKVPGDFAEPYGDGKSRLVIKGPRALIAAYDIPRLSTH